MIGIFSDIHGHALALQKTINVLKNEGAKSFICLGDAVGYIPSTEPIIILSTMDNLSFCLRGNHEEMILSRFDDEKKIKVYKTKEILDSLSPEEEKFLNNCSSNICKKYQCGTALFVHGSPSDYTNGYVYPDTDLEVFGGVDASYVFMGHTHRPFIRQSNSTTFINVGSCGMPRDHGEWGSAALFDEETGNVRIVRFSIKEETESLLNNTSNIHPSVLELFERKDTDCFGEFLDV